MPRATPKRRNPDGNPKAPTTPYSQTATTPNRYPVQKLMFLFIKQLTLINAQNEEISSHTFVCHSFDSPRRFSVCKSRQQSPLKAGDKVIEVNGVLVTDETIQEVYELLSSFYFFIDFIYFSFLIIKSNKNETFKPKSL